MRDCRLRRSISAYLKEKQESNRHPKYIRQTELCLYRFGEYCLARGAQNVNTITLEHLKGYLAQFDRNPASTQRLVYAMVGGFLKWADRPFMLRYKQKVTGRGRSVTWLAPRQIAQLLANLERMKPVDAVLIAFGLLAGLRETEVLTMTEETARLGLEMGVVSVIGKGSKTRPIPLHPKLRETMERYIGSDPRQMKDGMFVKMGPTQYHRRLKSVGRQYGMKLSSHVLRRSFGRSLNQKRVPLPTISAIMGHSNPATTLLYIGYDLDSMQTAILELEVPITTYPPKIVREATMPA